MPALARCRRGLAAADPVAVRVVVRRLCHVRPFWHILVCEAVAQLLTLANVSLRAGTAISVTRTIAAHAFAYRLTSAFSIPTVSLAWSIFAGLTSII